MKSSFQFSSQEVIAFAIKTENHYADWHQELANRFRPFDKSLSCLFEALAQEDRNTRQELIKVADQLSGKPVSLTVADDELEKPQIRDCEDGHKHFFVVHERMATALLDIAIQFECAAQRFYERCSRVEKNPVLRTLYNRLGELEAQHAQILEECRERFHTESDLRLARLLA